MTLRRKLQLLAWFTILGLGATLVITISSLNAMREAQDAAFRREIYSRQLVDIKAYAIATIMLDPTLKETRDVFQDAEVNISKYQQTIYDTIRR